MQRGRVAGPSLASVDSAGLVARMEDNMSILEIIHLRSSCKPIEDLAKLIRESLWEDGRKDGVFAIYRRRGLATDLAVHIPHAEECAEVPSRFGLQLVSSLAEFGLVEHSVWEEIGCGPVDQQQGHAAIDDGESS